MKHSNFHNWHLLAATFLMLLTVSPTRSQQPNPTETPADEVLRISTELVQTDVTVVDKQGRFVDGLKAEQFELKVDGKPQPIAFFERVTAGSPSESKQLLAARGSANIEVGPAPTVLGRTIIFFIDDLHLSADSVQRVRKVLLRFIEKEMTADDMVAIASPSGSIGFLQQFTNNKAVLRSAVARITFQSFAVGDSQRPVMTEFQAQAIDRGENDVREPFVEQLLRENPRMLRSMAESMVLQRAGQILKQSSAVTINMLSSLDFLVRTSARFPGRKLAFFLSDGFYIDRRNSDTQNRLSRVTTAAARAGLVVYTLDARGLVTGAPDPTEAEAFDPYGQRARSIATSQVSHAQDALITLAEHTGGRVFINQNSLSSGVTEALAEISNYYLLAWRPDPETNRGGKFRRLEVKILDNSDLKVRARRGFLTEENTVATTSGNKGAEAPAVPKTADEELRAALNERLPRKGLPTYLAVNYVDLPEKVVMLTVAMKVPARALIFVPVGDNVGATLAVLGAVYDEKGQALSSFQDELKITAASSQSGQLEKQKAVFTSQVPLKPGLYQVRIAARDPQSKLLGSATEWIEIPDLGKGQLALSGLFVNEMHPGAAESEADAFKLANLSIDRRLSNTSRLLFLLYVYNALHTTSGGSSTDVAVQVEMFSGAKTVLRTQWRPLSTEGLTDLSRIPYSAEIPLTGMARGRYRLQITAADRVTKTSTSQFINFDID
jgi:VWFA-related protein